MDTHYDNISGGGGGGGGGGWSGVRIKLIKSDIK